MSESKDEVDTREMLELQLTEVEMLQSMLSNPGEFVMDNPAVLEEFRAFVDGIIDYNCLMQRIDFTIKILPYALPACQLEVLCAFPHKYPSVHPEVIIRAFSLDGEGRKLLNADFHKYLNSLESGQIMIGSVVDWLQDNIHLYVKEDKNVDKQIEPQPASDPKERTFMRQWIYSHHIYSKIKRCAIVNCASELGLRGFSMPGKPGIICVEGETQCVKDFWSFIRSMNWKHITIKEQEEKEVKEEEIPDFFKFSTFQELNLEAQERRGRNYHMDLGMFFEFLQQHDSAHIFPLYFGVEGKGVKKT